MSIEGKGSRKQVGVFIYDKSSVRSAGKLVEKLESYWVGQGKVDSDRGSLEAMEVDRVNGVNF